MHCYLTKDANGLTKRSNGVYCILWLSWTTATSLQHLLQHFATKKTLKIKSISVSFKLHTVN